MPGLQLGRKGAEEVTPQGGVSTEPWLEQVSNSCSFFLSIPRAETGTLHMREHEPHVRQQI